MKLTVFFSFILFSTIAETAAAQNAYVKLGQQALMEGNFRTAVLQLEKACLVDSTNANALWMLGYSYYHSENYKKSIAAYTKVVAIKPADASAYYYRARAKSYMAKDEQVAASEKEKYLLGALLDFTKAITIDPADEKFYQNRGIAYREYGIFKLQANSKTYDKTRGINSLKASIADLEKVLNENPSRVDIYTQIQMSKDKLAGITGRQSMK